ncbi:MAG: histidine phosphatase family protein [Firmicutes bacterium]|nr:histidine phosphatase family protein [Bacillota bacterium]
MKSQIHLIRHGITEGNQRRLYYGAADIPLAEEGVNMLKSLVSKGIYPRAESSDFYTTGMLRTEQTLSILYGEREHSCIEELREMSFGEFEMKSYEELKDVPGYAEWAADKTGQMASPGGESIAGFTSRIRGGLKILVGKHRLRELSVRHSGKDAISTVVCHGGTIASIMEQSFPGQKEHFYKWIPDPGHGYTLDMKDGEITGYQEF